MTSKDLVVLTVVSEMGTFSRSRAGRIGRRAAPCNCFPAGTKVATANGEKSIEDIKVGDKVWATDLATGKRELRKITSLFHKHADELMTMTVAGTTVTVTSKHPFYVPGRGWIISGKLKVGDHLLQRDGTTATITAISYSDAATTVYNFEVEGDHNYYISEAQLLVHNCDAGSEFSTRYEKAGELGNKYTEGQSTRDPASQWYHEELSDDDLLDRINNVDEG